MLQPRRRMTTDTTSSRNFSEIVDGPLVVMAGHRRDYLPTPALPKCLCRRRIKTAAASPANKPSRTDSIGKPGIKTTTTPAVLVTTVCCAPICSELTSSTSIAAQCRAVSIIVKVIFNPLSATNVSGRMDVDRDDSTFSTVQPRSRNHPR